MSEVEELPWPVARQLGSSSSVATAMSTRPAVAESVASSSFETQAAGLLWLRQFRKRSD